MNQLNNEKNLDGLANHLIKAPNTNMDSTILDNIVLEKVSLEIWQIDHILPIDVKSIILELPNINNYNGKIINYGGNIISKDMEILSKELFHKFIFNFLILNKEPKYNFDNDAQYIGNLKHEIDKTYLLYKEIVEKEVSLSSSISYLDKANVALNFLDNYEDKKNLENFVYKIFRGRFRQCHGVNRYIKKFKNIPFFIEDLIKLIKGKYYMKVDAGSINILFSLLGIIAFKRIEDQKIFYLKMLQFKHDNEYLFD